MNAPRESSSGRTLLRCCAVVLLFGIISAIGGDWPQYRGPDHNAVSTERINKQWTGSVTNPVWRVYLTNGLTSLTIGGGRVFTQIAGSPGVDGYPRKEYCLALNATNGATLWSTEVESSGSPLYPNGGVGDTDDGPRTTPTVDGGSVYVLTTYLKLYRLNATNGAVIWKTNLLQGFGGSVIQWQNAASPVLENGLIFVNANSPTESLMAFNASDGTLAWRSQNEAMTHATPVLTTMFGVRQLIFATQAGLVSLNPQTGNRLWKADYPFGYNISLAASPAVFSNIVFITAQYNMGSASYEIQHTNETFVPQLLWSSGAHESHWSTPVCYQGAAFCQFTPDGPTAALRCIDLVSGATRWSVSGFGRGSTMLVGTNLLVITERGDLVLAAASTNAYIELARFKAIPNYSGGANKCWNALALSDGQLYVRSTAYAARFDLSVPDLELDTPQLVSSDKLQLTIRTTTGTPVNSNRLNGMEVRATTNAALPPSLWSAITNGLVLTNGIVSVTNVDALQPQRFFIVNEPQ